MDPCTELFGRIWLSTLRGIAPQFMSQKASDEKMLIAKEKIADSVEKLSAKRATLERQVHTLTLETKGYLDKKDQRAARAAITRRRFALDQLKNVDNMVVSLEAQLDAISSTETNVAVLDAFKSSTKAFSNWQNNSEAGNVDNVDSIRQDFEEQITRASEIAQIASQPLQNSTHVAGELTLEDMERELEGLDAPEADFDAQAGEALTTQIYSLPKAPVSMSATDRDDDDPHAAEAPLLAQ